MPIEIKFEDDNETPKPESKPDVLSSAPEALLKHIEAEDELGADTDSTPAVDAAPEREPTPIAEPEPLSELDKVKLELAALKAAIQAKPNQVGSTDLSAIVRDAVIAATIGISKANNDNDLRRREELIKENIRKTKRCPICNLPETACGGAPEKKNAKTGEIEYDGTVNHIRAYVGPKDEDLFEWFQGIIIRNVRFLSDYYGHLIWVPKKSDILTMVNAWEANEKALSRRRKAQGNGAKVSYGSQGPQQAIGWR